MNGDQGYYHGMPSMPGMAGNMPRGLGPFGGQPQQMPFNPNLRSSGGPPQQFPNAGLQPQVGMQQTGMFMAGGGGPVLPGGMGTGPAAWGFNNVVGQPGFDGAMGGLANGMMGLNPSPRPFGVPLMGMEPEPDFGGGGMPMDPFLLNGQGGLVGGLPPPQGRGGMGVMGLGGMDNITPGGPILNPSMMGSGGGGAGMIDQRAQNLIGGGIARGQYPQGQMPQQPVGPMPFQNLGGIGLGLNTAGLGAPTGNSGSVIPDPMMAQPRPVDDEKNSLKFGMHGLLEVIRASDNKDLQQITLGSDLLGFGLNLNANDPIFPTFAGPFADHGVAADPVFSIPTCYGMQTPPLKAEQLALFKIETLMYMFYACPRDLLQAIAAQELYRRDWKYHGELKVWLKPRTPQDLLQSLPQNPFNHFDTVTWEIRVYQVPYRGNLSAGFLANEDVQVKTIAPPQSGPT